MWSLPPMGRPYGGSRPGHRESSRSAACVPGTMVSVRDELVGRDVELTAALSAWARRRAGVVVTGPSRASGAAPSRLRWPRASPSEEQTSWSCGRLERRRSSRSPRSPRSCSRSGQTVDPSSMRSPRNCTDGRPPVRWPSSSTTASCSMPGSTAALADLLDAGVGFVAVTASAAEPDDRLLAHPGADPADARPARSSPRSERSCGPGAPTWSTSSGGTSAAVATPGPSFACSPSKDRTPVSTLTTMTSTGCSSGSTPTAGNALEVLAVAEPLPVSIFIGLLDPAAPSPAMRPRRGRRR